MDFITTTTVSQGNINLVHFIKDRLCAYYAVWTRFSFNVPFTRADFHLLLRFSSVNWFPSVLNVNLRTLTEGKTAKYGNLKKMLFRTCGKNEHKRTFILLIAKFLLQSPGIVKFVVNAWNWHRYSWQIRFSPLRTFSPTNRCHLHNDFIKKNIVWACQPSNKDNGFFNCFFVSKGLTILALFTWRRTLET
jgi:hypothetical protein